MEEISIEDMDGSPHAGPFGYGGPGWETRQKLGAYGSLESLFSGMKDDNKTSLAIQEDILIDFFEYFLHQYGVENNNFSKNTIVQNNKISNRFNIMEID